MKKEPESDSMAPEYDFSRARKGRYSGRMFVDPQTPPGTHVVLRRPIAECELEVGDVGQVLGSGPESKLKVEFKITSKSESVTAVLSPGDLRLPTNSEVLHVRETRTT